MDRMNFYLYQKGEEHVYYGKDEKVKHVKIKTPSLRRWFIILEVSENPEDVFVEWRIVE